MVHAPCSGCQKVNIFASVITFSSTTRQCSPGQIQNQSSVQILISCPFKYFHQLLKFDARPQGGWRTRSGQPLSASYTRMPSGHYHWPSENRKLHVTLAKDTPTTPGFTFCHRPTPHRVLANFDVFARLMNMLKTRPGGGSLVLATRRHKEESRELRPGAVGSFCAPC